MPHLSNRRMTIPPHRERSLDREIAEVEQRIATRRGELRAATAEAKERMRASVGRPQLLLAVLALSFVVARLARVGARRSSTAPRKSSRVGRLLRLALSAAIARFLPVFVGPLQGLASQWLGRRFD